MVQLLQLCHHDVHLVGGLEPWIFMIFHSVGNNLIPTDELTFFRGVGIPPTSHDVHHGTYPTSGALGSDV